MARGGSRGVGWGVCIFPPAIFKHVFDVYNFSIILILFDSDKPYALSTRNWKCANKTWRSTQYKGQKIRTKFAWNYSKSTKIAITAQIFKIFPEEHAPFCFPQPASNLFCRKKIRLKKMWKLWPPPFKVSSFATDDNVFLISGRNSNICGRYDLFLFITWFWGTTDQRAKTEFLPRGPKFLSAPLPEWYPGPSLPEHCLVKPRNQTYLLLKVKLKIWSTMSLTLP